jgi:hypothetical protein
MSFVFILAIVTGCTDWDDFTKYQTGGEIIYPGRGDTAIASSGRDRAELAWVLSSDPRVTKYKLYWNNRGDSLEAPIPREAIGDTLRIMVDPLKEGTYNFEIISFDEKGNKSVPMRFTGRSYGDNYELSLLNRTISTAQFDSTLHVLTVNWNEPDSVNVTTELNYTGLDLKLKTIQVAPEATESKIENWKPGTTLHFKSSFKPDRRAIDIFHVIKSDTVLVQME